MIIFKLLYQPTFLLENWWYQIEISRNKFKQNNMSPIYESYLILDIYWVFFLKILWIFIALVVLRKCLFIVEGSVGEI